jgi:hypothetical protein
MAQQNTPFTEGSAGQNAFRAAYDRLKAEAEARKQGIAQDYSSAYQQMRGQSYAQGLGAAAQQGLSGGQSAGMRNQVSAAQMGQLGNLMQGQEKALREAKVDETSIYSNALLEGQQAQQYQQQQQQYNESTRQQITAIMSDTTLTEEQRRQAVTNLGGDYDALTQAQQQQNLNSKSDWDIWWNNFGSGLMANDEEAIAEGGGLRTGGGIFSIFRGTAPVFMERDPQTGQVRQYTYQNGRKVYQ